MSLTAYSKVWESSRQNGSHLLVLLALADYAKDDGTGAYGTNKRMAKKARLKHERSLVRIYQELVGADELVVEYGVGPEFKGSPTNLYHIIYQDGTNEGAINYIKARIEGVTKRSSPPKGVRKSSGGGVTKRSSHKDKHDSETSASSSANASDSATRRTKRSAGKPGQPALFRGAPSGARQGADIGEVRLQKNARKEKLDANVLRAMFRLCYLTSGAYGHAPVGDRQAGQAATAIRNLLANGVAVTEATLDQFTLWWAGNYRSRPQGQPEVYKPPLPRQVQELWAEAMQERDKARAAREAADLASPSPADLAARGRVEGAMLAFSKMLREGQR